MSNGSYYFCITNRILLWLWPDLMSFPCAPNNKQPSKKLHIKLGGKIAKEISLTRSLIEMDETHESTIRVWLSVWNKLSKISMCNYDAFQFASTNWQLLFSSIDFFDIDIPDTILIRAWCVSMKLNNWVLVW